MSAWRSALRVLGLGRFSLANNLRTPHAWVGFGLLAAITALGMYTGYRNTGAWTLHGGFLRTGGYVAALFALRSGIVTQREGGLQTFLRMNYVRPVEHVAGAIVCLVSMWILVTLSVFVLGLVLPGFGFTLVAWHAWVVALNIGILLPFVFLTELYSTIEVPLVLPALILTAVIAAILAVSDVHEVARLIQPAMPGSFAGTRTMLLRAASSCTAGFGAILAATALRHR